MKKSGFTLIELLVVIAIISLLVSILLPSLKAAQKLAKDVVCMSNMKAIAMSVQMYANDNDGVVVPGLTTTNHPRTGANANAWFWDYLSANYLVTGSWSEWNWEKAPQFYCPLSESPSWALPMSCNRWVMYGYWAWYGRPMLKLAEINPETALIMDSNGLMGMVHPQQAGVWINPGATDENNTYVQFRHTGDKAHVVTPSGAVRSATRDEMEETGGF